MWTASATPLPFSTSLPAVLRFTSCLPRFMTKKPPEIKPESCIYPTEIGCSILPNVEEMAFIEAEFYKNESYIVALRERLREYATKEFDITLIDCPPSMGGFRVYGDDRLRLYHCAHPCGVAFLARRYHENHQCDHQIAARS